MSEEGPTSSAQNPKLLLGTAVITAVTTICVLHWHCPAAPQR